MKRKLIAIDCETDPAEYGRVPSPFIWGTYDGKKFQHFASTIAFVEWAKQQHAILYAHNGGKFDFMFLLKYIERSKAKVINGRIVKMMLGRAELRDSMALIPEALKGFGKSEIDYAKMDKNSRQENIDEIIAYLKQDCVVLYNLVNEFRKIAGKQLTIASCALTYCKKLGVNPGKTNYTFDRNLREYFYGGRCQVFSPGSFHNMRVLDIHSAYPYAMTFDHATGSEWHHINPIQFHSLSREEQQRCFITLRCFSDMAFPKRDKIELRFPREENEYCVTGWEYIAARDLNLLRDVQFLDIISFPNSINFKPYVEHWYAYKEAHNKSTHPIQYHIGKRMQNSLYGKMSQDCTNYFDYKIVPGGTLVCQKFEPNGQFCYHCGEIESEHGYSLYTEYDTIEIHRRPSTWFYEYKYGATEWKKYPLYYNVATGASITGFTRAHLLRAIHAIGIAHVAYIDTDSIICDADASLTALPLSPRVGDWADEGTASLAHFAGKKIYGLRMRQICSVYDATPKKRCAKCFAPKKEHGSRPIIKIASKGSKLDFNQIEQLMNNKIVTWKSDFPSFSLAGEPNFVLRKIRKTVGTTISQIAA